MAKQLRKSGFSERKTSYRAPRREAARLGVAAPVTLPDGTVRFVLKLGAKGRVVLPSEMRSAMGLQEGAIVLAWFKDGKVTLESQRAALKKIQDDNRLRAGGRSMVDELIAERRAAAARGE